MAMGHSAQLHEWPDLTVLPGGARMHDNPRANEEEQELAQTDRMEEDEEQRSGYAPPETADGDEEEDSARASAPHPDPARAELLAGLPGETLALLARRMEREEVAPGAVLIREGDLDDRFYVLLSGVLAVSQHDLGPQSVLRPGDYFGEVAPAM